MSMIYGGRTDGKSDHSGLSFQTQKALIELDKSGEPQPAPIPPEPKYKTGSDQGKLTNEASLREALKKQGVPSSEIDRRVEQHKKQTGLR